jgi:hypothetical protein
MESQTLWNKLEGKMKNFETRFGAGVMDWVRNDSFFDILRSTPARLALWFLTVGVLYGIPIAAYLVPSIQIWIYAVALAVCFGFQTISTRFVFNDHEVIDEYQLSRRNEAYRRAFRWVGGILGLLAVLFLIQISNYEKSMGSGWQVEIDPYILWFGLIWVVGLFALQPYLSWGIKGEPRITN